MLDDIFNKQVFPKHIRHFRNIYLVHFSEKASENIRFRSLAHGAQFSKFDAHLEFISWGALFPGSTKVASNDCMFGSKNICGGIV